MNRLYRLGNMFDNVGRNFALQAGVYGAYFKGQLGKSVVGGTWKNKKTLRTYAIPTNPNTSDQQAVRGKFKISQVVGSHLLTTVIHPFWNPFADGQSGFNAFIGLNSLRASDNENFIGLLVTSGSYEGIAAITTKTYNTANGQVIIDWDDSVQNIGNVSDRVVIVALDTSDYDPLVKTPILLSSVTTDKVRSDASEDLTLRTGLTPADVIVFLGTTQPAANPILVIGNSISGACVAS